MIVGVMATSDEDTTKKYHSLAKFVGGLIAAEGFHLLTGGGQGLMEVAGKEFLDTKGRTGKLISILRADGTAHLTGLWDKKGKLYADETGKETLSEEMQKLVKRRSEATRRDWEPNEDNELAEIVIRTHLPYSGARGEHDLSRNHINILTSDLIVILPGGVGTLSELRLAHEYDKPTAVFLDGGNVGGKGAERIKSDFAGITAANAANELKAWLVSTRERLAAGKRHCRGRFI